MQRVFALELFGGSSEGGYDIGTNKSNNLLHVLGDTFLGLTIGMILRLKTANGTLFSRVNPDGKYPITLMSERSFFGSKPAATHRLPPLYRQQA